MYKESVLNFDFDNYDYQRNTNAVSIAALADGATAADQIFDIRQDFEELVGIAIYDRSASVFQFQMMAQIVQGDVVQDFAARKNWVFSGAASTDGNMPECEHYKVVRIPYLATGKKKILFRIKNTTGAAFGSTLLLDIVLLTRRKRQN